MTGNVLQDIQPIGSQYTITSVTSDKVEQVLNRVLSDQCCATKSVEKHRHGRPFRRG